MTTTKLTQVCTYANWPNESFEIWRLCPVSLGYKKISKEMRALFMWIFPEIVTNKAIEDLANASFIVGGTDEEIEFNQSEAQDIIKKVYYGWYSGRCLDAQRLQYFKLEKIIKRGIVKLLDRNHLEICEATTAFTRKQSHEINIILELRRTLGDDPKRIEIDESRLKFELPANNLFSWKEEFNIQKRKRKTATVRIRKCKVFAVKGK